MAQARADALEEAAMCADDAAAEAEADEDAASFEGGSTYDRRSETEARNIATRIRAMKAQVHGLKTST